MIHLDTQSLIMVLAAGTREDRLRKLDGTQPHHPAGSLFLPFLRACSSGSQNAVASSSRWVLNCSISGNGSPDKMMIGMPMSPG